MEKMSEMQSPRIVNVQSSQQKNTVGANSGQTWAVAKQVEKWNRETRMYLGWSRGKGVGRWMTIRSFFLKERKERKPFAEVCQGSAGFKWVYLI